MDLRQVVGLTMVQHDGPSTVGSDTFYKSNGEIPDIFLRGCGLPDEMIGFVHSIAGAIQYYSAFISYNHEDEAFATRLYNDLQANNVRCWKYTEDVKIGDPIHTRVDEAIRLHDKLLVIFSEHAVRSDWVEGEVETALAREKRTGQQVLFPVTIDAAVKDVHLGWAAEIRRTRNIGNFTGWEQQQQYQPMFDRLLRDLKADSLPYATIERVPSIVTVVQPYKSQLERLKASIADDDGCVSWNMWRQNAPHEHIALNGADLNGTQLRGVDLSSANLSGINFNMADLSNAQLSSHFNPIPHDSLPAQR